MMKLHFLDRLLGMSEGMGTFMLWMHLLTNDLEIMTRMYHEGCRRRVQLV